MGGLEGGLGPYADTHPVLMVEGHGAKISPSCMKPDFSIGMIGTNVFMCKIVVKINLGSFEEKYY
jgi:hypothetical protein